LAISQKLIRMMGGQIWVTSEEGEGSCFGFSLTLPVPETTTPGFRHRPMGTSQQTAPPPPPAPEPLRPIRVLAAEDNKTNRLVFSRMVKDLVIDLQFAENGREAVEMFESFRPDILFTDISMPEMDGKEATRRIRTLENGAARLPIIAMTAHAMDGDEDGILAAGVDHYLTKPLKKQAIIDHITALRGDRLMPPLSSDQAAS
jgi:CheY-like chemotaxis protein